MEESKAEEPFELFEGGRIVLILEPVSWRYGIHGLKIIAAAVTGQLPEDTGDWYVFIHRRRTAARVLHCGSRAVTLYEQRFCDGSRFPSCIKALQEDASGQTELTREELKLMFAGGTAVLRFS